VRKFLILIGCFTLAGCVTPEQQAQVFATQTAPSGAVKSSVVKHVQENFFDPYSIRDAAISDVVNLGTTGLQAVCVRANGKNRFGAYVGLTATSVRLKDGVAVSSLQSAPACSDQRMRYRPFPELEAL
jgi:hypothetical protein